jgi:iron complex transport system permease protein
VSSEGRSANADRLVSVLMSFWSLLALTVLAVVIAAQFGAVAVSSGDWIEAFLPTSSAAGTGGSYVLWNFRLPRIVFAVLVGAALALSGVLTQGLFRNPLADAGLLGVAAGAGCVAALSIVFFSGLSISIPVAWRIGLLPVMAFCGALLVCFTLDRVARWITAGSIVGLLLTGIALNALAGAVIGLCTYFSTDEQLRNLTFWTMGSVAGANWSLVILLFSLTLLSWWRATKLASAINALALGEAAAGHVGIDIGYVRTQIMMIVALLIGFAVAWCGMIGFIGLIAPHIARTIVGPDQRKLIPVSMAIGGILLLVADTIARSIAIPSEIPIGIFTASLGGPFFLVLLRSIRGRIA